MRLRDIKGFTGPRSVDLSFVRPDGTYAGWTVLAGRNGTGKTSLLRAIALVIGGPNTALALMPDFANWVSTGSSEARAMIAIAYDRDDKWSIGGQPTYGENPITAPALGLTWRLPDDFSLVGTQPYLAVDRFVEPKALEGPWFQNPHGWFCAAYGPFRRLSGDARGLVRGPRQVARFASLFYEDAALSEGVAWLIEQKTRALEGHQAAAKLVEVVLEILSDDMLPDGHTFDRVDSDGLQVVKGGRSFPLTGMSDGYRTVVALVVDILKQIHDAFAELAIAYDEETPTVPAAGVVIIDEIDAHLHIAWQKRIGWWLKTHFPNVQFIVTTHSPYVCQDADPGGLIRLPGPDEEASPEVVSEDLWERVVYGSADDAVVSEIFGIDSTFSTVARRMRRELTGLELKVIKGTATEAETVQYQAIRKKLRSSPATRSLELGAVLRDGGAAGE
ncbi:AAA family ATPase [Actinocorallia lasiicapitis]